VVREAHLLCPGKPLLKVTTKTHCQFWCKVDGADTYLMQFYSAAKATT